MSTNTNVADALLTVLGGGPAGLATGFYARREGLDVRLLEATDAVGGNARTLQLGPFTTTPARTASTTKTRRSPPT